MAFISHAPIDSRNRKKKDVIARGLLSGRSIRYPGGGGGLRPNKSLCTGNGPLFSGPCNKFHFYPQEKFPDLVGGWVSQNPRKARIAPPPPHVPLSNPLVMVMARQDHVQRGRGVVQPGAHWKGQGRDEFMPALLRSGVVSRALRRFAFTAAVIMLRFCGAISPLGGGDHIMTPPPPRPRGGGGASQQRGGGSRGGGVTTPLTTGGLSCGCSLRRPHDPSILHPFT